MPTLDEVVNPPKRTLEVNGKTYYPRTLDAFGFQLVTEAQNNPEDVAAMCKVIARGYGVPFGEVFGTEDQIGFSLFDLNRAVNALTEQVASVEASASPLSEPAGARGA